MSSEPAPHDRIVIAAAVRALYGPSAFIRRIRPAPGRRAGVWTHEGRLAIQASHRMADPLIALPRPRGARP